VDPRTLVPLDMATIVRSVVKTGRLMVAEEGHRTHGFGAEVAARVAEVAWGALKAPLKRVAALDTPIPYNRALENAVVPDAGRIREAVLEVMGR
jgi:pyruvate/2-oxoglutarate/acetoin dehydrogenase E1 component